MSATVAAALKKAAVYILGDEKKRGKLVTAVLSAAVGLLLLLCAPAVMLSSLGEVGEEAQVPELHLNAYDIYSSLDSESRQRLDDIRSAGNDIANAMDEKGVKVHTIKAQLIYMSYFDEVQNFYAESYANLFAAAPNDSDLINAINSTYGLEIDYDEFIRTYTWVMNSTLNPYMFNDAGSKNCTDLAAWAENAFISGWGYKSGAVGERDETDRIRYADNAGLMLGYLNYSPTDKAFGSDYSTLVYTEQGSLDTMPEVAGVGLFDGSQHGIYVGNGEVVYSSESVGYVTKEPVSNGSWTSWCTYEGIEYPQEVEDAIESLSGESSSE
ncbi:hypothetical protein [Ruminococcus bicirculans (ex Wegman et al. 2014)]|uniref:hypothetical protein n=1 Tax=Ruminococcus bicirculans (ex Wegman et al. 2014) TaxID=1160721 RepID=UPI00242D859C|nr:hypothetical protein [Ruminococcus bicirculans (ex Wegman et al. 2014)]